MRHQKRSRKHHNLLPEHQNKLPEYQNILPEHQPMQNMEDTARELTNILSVAISDSCDAVFYTLLYQHQGRQFQKIATYYNNSLMVTDKLFPNKRYGLNGRKLLIGTNMVRVYHQLTIINNIIII